MASRFQSTSRILQSSRNSFSRSVAGARCKVARRTLATPAATGQAASTATNRAEVTLRRFWKSVGIEKRDDFFAIMLDKRPLKTPSGNALLLPPNKKLAATLIAAEWENQDQLLKQHSLPITSLASRAIDAFEEEAARKEAREKLLEYLETDTICFHQNEPPTMVELQQKHWFPLLAWVETTFQVKINTSESLLLPPHPGETAMKLDEVMAKFDPWQMAAMERAVYTSKSFIIALALVMRHISADQAAMAAHVEVNSQIERWGEVEDSHDVDYHDIRRQLGSVACLLSTL